MQTVRILLVIGIASVVLAQPRQPDLAAQRAAMKKLEFLLGRWEGDAKILRGPGEPVSVRQSEDVHMKLDGLVMLIEGTGRDPQTGKVQFSAMATISYDEATSVYKFRSFSEGRYLDTEIKVREKGFERGLDAGPAKIRYVMRLSEKRRVGGIRRSRVRHIPSAPDADMTLRRVKLFTVAKPCLIGVYITATGGLFQPSR